MTNYFHEDVRQCVSVSLRQFTLAIAAAYPTAPYEKGKPAHEQPLNGNVAQFVDIVIPVYVTMLEQDDDKDTIISICESVSIIAKELGPAALEKYLPSLVTCFVNLIKKKAACFNQEEDEGEDDSEREILVIEYSCDCIVDICKVIKTMIAPYFEFICAEIFKYFSKESPRYRSLAAGTLAELSSAEGPLVANYLTNLFPLVFRGLEDSDEETRSNCAYWCGVLCENGGDTATNFYNDILQRLSVLFRSRNSIPNIIDNASAAIARMILARPQKLPMEQILPVFLAEIPMKKDYEENKTVFEALFSLLRANHPSIAPHLPTVMGIFARVLGTAEIPQNIQIEIVNLIKQLIQQNGAHVEQIFQSLPAPEQQNLQKYLS
eukprot:TRINITY_DN6368_c0_g1_i2.p1 TRINITY_DN6368_c0_g1~~TRINITY_DN6368_c0_g1_i2.p1  ORF type:complete len:378 (-),score=90.76 TRINITY_DN6368_c0_g1_i2:45-1178(-)